MLVFFIHGVATRDVNYADPLKSLIKDEFIRREEPLPHFHSSFWGNVLRDVDKMWHWIEQDLQSFKKDNPEADLDEIFRYKKFREGFLSQFFGDLLTYLNSDCGVEIRKIIAQDLYKFIQKYPEETDLHIVAHSLGSVILWDVLFSDRFLPKDPAFYIRELINGLGKSNSVRKVNLKSITTIGSPILFLNTMLAVKPEKVENFVETYQNEPFKWMNVIHSSDIIAYPIRSSLSIKPSSKFIFQDEYIFSDANYLEKAARSIGQLEAAMALGMADAHVGYFKCQKTARLVVKNFLAESNSQSLNLNMIYKAIFLLEKVPGMTKDVLQLSRRTSLDETLAELKFRDGSGTLRFCVNPLKIHHVYVFDSQDVIKYVGYVGWIHGNNLQQEIELIKRDFCN